MGTGHSSLQSQNLGAICGLQNLTGRFEPNIQALCLLDHAQRGAPNSAGPDEYALQRIGDSSWKS